VADPLHAEEEGVIRLAPAILAAAAGVWAVRAPADPACASQPRSSQFDFWVGAWDVTPSEGQADAGKVIASSREEKIAGGCALLESYEEPGGYSGKSVNFVDPISKRWRQLWVDGAGNTSEFEGDFRDGAMRFEGESHVASGKRILRKLTFTPLPDGSVRQRSEASLDGKTWKVNYDYTYVRRKEAAGPASP
jgi:hypothetical protein